MWSPPFFFSIHAFLTCLLSTSCLLGTVPVVRDTAVNETVPAFKELHSRGRWGGGNREEMGNQPQ